MARQKPRQTDKPLRMFVADLPDWQNVSNNIVLLLVTIVSDDANNPFSSAKLLEVLAYAKLFSQNISHPFSRQTIRVTAMTGAAAMRSVE
jgi:hypothetical protein